MQTDTEPLDMTDEALKKWTALALNPREGEAFEFGGKTFHRQFMTAQGESDLLALITSVTEAAPTSSIAATFAMSLEHLFGAVALILSDQDHECDEVWVRLIRGPRLAEQMLAIFIAQIQLQEMMPLLGGLLAAAGLARAVAAKTESFPSTSPISH